MPLNVHFILQTHTAHSIFPCRATAFFAACFEYIDTSLWIPCVKHRAFSHGIKKRPISALVGVVNSCYVTCVCSIVIFQPYNKQNIGTRGGGVTECQRAVFKDISLMRIWLMWEGGGGGGESGPRPTMTSLCADVILSR